jgi:hypothetical protein
MDNKPSSRERTAQFIVTILSFAAYVLVNVYGRWPRWTWIFLLFAVGSVISYLYHPCKETLLSWKERWDDRKAAKKAFPELQEFVRRFVQFVNRQTNDTLHYIVESDIYRGQAALRADCQLPNVDLWVHPRQYFSERIDRQPKTMKELRPALMEFHYLVASYNNFCVSPIFETLPANIRAQITPPVLAKLGLFQQKFQSYLEGYQLFVERLVESRPILRGTPSTFNMPKPMA